jgi:hypothetical protein
MRKSASRTVAAMADLQALDGGWGYYNFGWRLERPVNGNSFTTASIAGENLAIAPVLK